MKCDAVRKRMAGSRVSTEIERHLEGCNDCRDFAAHLNTLRSGLRGHHAGATPDPSFATRVRSQLKSTERVEVLGWAALRLLPVSLVVALLLAWVAWERSAVIVEVSAPVAEVSTDPLEWLFDGSEDSP